MQGADPDTKLAHEVVYLHVFVTENSFKPSTSWIFITAPGAVEPAVVNRCGAWMLTEYGVDCRLQKP